MNMIEKKRQPSTEDLQVIDYLRNHPDFFSRHPEVLETLYLPHPSGTAVSLVEKQVSVLRERNTQLRTQLNDLMERSKTNDGLFTKSRSLVLKLIAAESTADVITALTKSFKQDFAIEFASITLLDSDLALPGLNTLTRDIARDKIASVLDSDDASCGVLRSQQLIALFGDDARLVGSAVALRLAIKNNAYGVLALGSADSHYYHNGMDTLFLRFLVDILNQVLYPKL